MRHNDAELTIAAAAGHTRSRPPRQGGPGSRSPRQGVPGLGAEGRRGGEGVHSCYSRLDLVHIQLGILLSFGSRYW